MIKLNTIYCEDCTELLRRIDNCVVDAIVTDPPYELGFMGKHWDASGIAYNVELWRECLRVLKPGGHLLAFGGTRTYHRMACAIEDAGFQPRNMLVWAYGQGFPKSLNIKKQLEKMGNNRASEFEGFGTDLKPAIEPICLARKSLDGTVAENCLKWGVGGLDIDGCRVGFISEEDKKESVDKNQHANFNSNNGIRVPTKGIYHGDNRPPENYNPTKGRFPANIILDGSEQVESCFPETKTGGSPATDKNRGKYGKNGMFAQGDKNISYANFANDSGSASRFFQHCSLSPEEVKSIIYIAKASKSERGGSTHPTMKPLALMEYLIKLVTREGQTVLDPFAGSGTTGVACINLKRDFILIEREPEYVEIGNSRLEAARRGELKSVRFEEDFAPNQLSLF